MVLLLTWACNLDPASLAPHQVVDLVGTVAAVGFEPDTAELAHGVDGLEMAASTLRKEPWTLVIRPDCDPLSCDLELAQQRAEVVAAQLVQLGARSVMATTSPVPGDQLASQTTTDGWLVVELKG